MKTMIKYMSGAFVLAFTQIALAVCPADCSCEKCTAKTAKSECGRSCKKICCASKVPEGLEKACYTVRGITCKDCVKIITKNLEKLEGVTVKGICVESGTVIIYFDPKKVQKKNLVVAINQGKFKVVAKKICPAGCSKPCCSVRKACSTDCSKPCCADKAK